MIQTHNVQFDMIIYLVKRPRKAESVMTFSLWINPDKLHDFMVMQFRMKKRQAVNETPAVFDLYSFWHVAKGPAKKMTKYKNISTTTFSFTIHVLSPFPRKSWLKIGISNEYI